MLILYYKSPLLLPEKVTGIILAWIVELITDCMMVICQYNANYLTIKFQIYLKQ